MNPQTQPKPEQRDNGKQVAFLQHVHAGIVYLLTLMLLYIKKLTSRFFLFVCSCMQSIFFDPDAFRCQKAEPSLSLRSFFLMVSVHVCQVYPFLLMLLLLIAV